MNIEQTTKFTWHVSDDNNNPVGTVDLDGDQYVAMQGADIIAICATLEEAAASYFN